MMMQIIIDLPQNLMYNTTSPFTKFKVIWTNENWVIGPYEFEVGGFYIMQYGKMEWLPKHLDDCYNISIVWDFLNFEHS